METQIKYPFIVDEQTLKAVIHTAVNSAVAEIVKDGKVEKRVQLKEASDFFSMTPVSLMKKAQSGEIPYYRFKGSRSPYYFYKSMIAEVLQTGKVLTLRDVMGAEFHNVK